MLGETLDGKYEILRLVGQGGMGAVYEARHLGTERRVAVKVIDERRPGAGGEAERRFRREARAAGAIDSEHIVEVLDASTDGAAGPLYIVMEHLRGEDLGRVLERTGPLPPDVVLRIGAQALDGLRKAHALGIVHRDIKPANLFLAQREGARIVTKVLDFGIAKIMPGVEDVPHTTELTESGGIVGSPRFMSPEQARSSKSIDHRTDLWSLGASLYCALTGHSPHHMATSVGDLILTLCTEPPPPLSDVAPWVPAPVARAVHRALALRPDDRYPTAQAMLDEILALLPAGDELREEMLVGLPKDVLALAAVLPPPLSTRPRGAETVGGQATGERPGAAPRKPRWWAILAGGAAVALAATLAFVVTRGPSASPGPQACAMGDLGECTARCERREAASCYTLGAMYEQGSGAPIDLVIAQRRYGEACAGGSGQACFRLGTMLAEGKGGPKDEAAARSRHQRACELGEAQGCNGLAILLAGGHGGPADPTRAVALYERACQAHFPPACSNLGIQYERGEGVPRDFARARALHTQACNEGAVSSCGMLAVDYATGRGGPRDEARAAELFERACTAGHGFACGGLAELKERGAGTPKDLAGAADLYRRACEGDPGACYNLGRLYERGEGVPEDMLRAVSLLERACASNVAEGCAELGTVLFEGRGVPKDTARAGALLQKACDAKVRSACETLAAPSADAGTAARSRKTPAGPLKPRPTPEMPQLGF